MNGEYYEMVLARIADRYDPDELIDILDVDSAELAELLKYRIFANLHLFEDIE